jgi:nitrogen fixation NifU-like protein
VGRGDAENPVCGDRLVLFVRAKDGVIAELRWRATACPATLAVAELAARTCQGRKADGVTLMTWLRDEVLRLGGLEPTERHALDLLSLALGRAVGARR